MSDLVFRTAEPADFDRTVELMALGFPGVDKFSPAFLQWQYYDNPAGPPVGCNIDDGGRLIGHLMGIPLRVTLKGRPTTVTLIMNVATHPDYRGRGLFLELVNRVVAMSAERGHAGVIGVANQQTERAYRTKLGFQNVAPLDAHVELAPQRLDVAHALETAQFSRTWDDATLAWRLKNPANPLRIAGGGPDRLVIEGASTLPLIRSRAVIPRRGLTTSAAGLAAGPAVVLGLTPKGTAGRTLAMTVPERLRPSPLVLIYKNHAKPDDRLDPDRVLFTFLDFDAF